MPIAGTLSLHTRTSATYTEWNLGILRPNGSLHWRGGQEVKVNNNALLIMDHPNLWRRPTVGDIAFVGDALMRASLRAA